MSEDKILLVGGFIQTEKEVRQLFQELICQTWGKRSSDAEGGWQPPIDIWDTEDAIIVEVELSGMTRRNVRIEVEEDTLRITGERHITVEHKRRHYYQAERMTGRFTRQIRLPHRVDHEHLRMKSHAGILSIKLPKKKPLR